MHFERIYEPGLAHASYFLGCHATGKAMVIDPKRDIESYLEIAERENLQISHICETHIHADFVSGTLELAAATHATIYLSDEGKKEWQYRFDHIGLKHDSVISVGNLEFRAIHTPGHTPEHLCFLLTDTLVSMEPVMVFTGDFVFVGDVGRPDLLEKTFGLIGNQEESARHLFHSLHQFKALPDYIQIWPAHGAGSICGKSIGAVPSSTVGYENKVNWAFQKMPEKTFISLLLQNQSEPPPYIPRMKQLNKKGPSIRGSQALPPKLSNKALNEQIKKGCKIIDARSKWAYVGGHVKNSINIQANKSFSTWAGWIIKEKEPVVLVCSSHQIQELTRAFARVGIDTPIGYFDDLTNWTSDGKELPQVDQISVNELKNINKQSIQLLDVRDQAEYKRGHILGSINIHAGHLDREYHRLVKNKAIIVLCESGDRSSTAAGGLTNQGFKVKNLMGGLNAWTKQGNKIES